MCVHGAHYYVHTNTNKNKNSSSSSSSKHAAAYTHMSSDESTYEANVSRHLMSSKITT